MVRMPEVSEGIRSRSQRILLIEDEAAIARLTALLLEAEGYDVQVVGSHREAVPLLSEEAFALVLADTERGASTSSLHGINGLVAAAGACPVLLFSAHRFPEVQIKAAGLAGSVRKPYDINDLLGAVARALDEGTPQSPAERSQHHS